MKAKRLYWDIDRIDRRRKEIDRKPQYQRTEVWSEAKKQLLIDSILRGFDMPKIYLRTLPDGHKYRWEVTDGQQRLTAIWEYIDDGYPLGESSGDLPDGDLRGLTYNNLPTSARDTIMEHELTIAELEDASDSEIRQLFLRLQQGVTLNSAERRNAIEGGMRDFIASLAQPPEHKLLDVVANSANRFGYDDLLAHCMAVHLAGGPSNLSGATLTRMYETNGGFKSISQAAKTFVRKLNLMHSILQPKAPAMDTKWGFVDLFLVVSKLVDEYAVTGQGYEPRILSTFNELEKDRRKHLRKPDALISAKRPSEINKDLYAYIQAFRLEGGKKKNLETRHHVYMRRLLLQIPELVPKDPRRDFTRDERMVIWMVAKQRCEKCAKKVAFEKMHADHKLPHSKGGATSVKNGRSLCAPCNLSIGAKGV